MMIDQEEERKFHSNIRDLHFLKLNSQDSIKYFKYCLAQRTNDDEEKWLVISDHMKMEEVIGQLADIELDLDDEIYLATTTSNSNSSIQHQHHSSKMNIWELYRIGRKPSPVHYNEVGQWNGENNFLDWTRVPKWKRRQNLQGYKLKLTTMAEAPFITSIIQSGNDGQFEVKGMFKDLLDLISDSLNITYKLEPPEDRKWGQDVGDGAWNGMIGLLQKGEADMGK